MKKILFRMVILITLESNAQNNIGVGTASPDASARLDIVATDKGILIPRLLLTNIMSPSPVNNPAPGLLCWNVNLFLEGGVGFYFWNGSRWQSLLSDPLAWKLGGNAGTNPTSQYIGTSDNQPLNFRVNNLKAGSINHLLYNAFLGTGAGLNTNPTNGSNARYNTMIGDSAGYSNTIGSSNTFVGRATGLANTSGSQNSLLGFSSNLSTGTLTNATAIGARSFVEASNSLILGSINGVNGAVEDTRVGIGTTTPEEKLEVVGNIKLSGELNRETTSSANLVPICYGTINSTGGILSGSGNFAVTNPSTGRYQIAIDDVVLTTGGYTALVTINNSGPRISTIATSSNQLAVFIFDLTGTQVNSNFNFVVYIP